MAKKNKQQDEANNGNRAERRAERAHARQLTRKQARKRLRGEARATGGSRVGAKVRPQKDPDLDILATELEDVEVREALDAEWECYRRARLWLGRKHARFIDPSVPYHVISKCFQGRWLLKPDRKRKLKRLIHGVIGRAQEKFPGVKLFIFNFMSNHLHMKLQGDPVSFVKFIGFVKREISRRWGQQVNWQGPMWAPYEYSALPSLRSQLQCFRYILGHGVKEDIVSRPEHWPGANCAEHLMTGKPLEGDWLDGTRYGAELHNARRRKTPSKKPDKRDFSTTYTVVLSPIPAWAHLSIEERQTRAREMVDDIEETEARRRKRQGKRLLGVEAALAMPRNTRKLPPRPPWYPERRAMIAWGSPRDPEIAAYLDRYWDFQRRFRAAADRLKAGQTDTRFPREAFRPGRLPTTRPMAA
jgi:REP element-mobilizing transposase RayT